MELRKLAIPVAVFTSILTVQTARAENGSKETAIRTLIKITDNISMVKQAVEHVLPTIWRWVKKTNPAIPDHVVSALDEELIQAVDESTPEFRKGLAAIDDEYFTETEINDLLVFYRTETGQKLVALTPQLLAEAVSFGKQWRRVFRPSFQTDGVESGVGYDAEEAGRLFKTFAPRITSYLYE